MAVRQHSLYLFHRQVDERGNAGAGWVGVAAHNCFPPFWIYGEMRHVFPLVIHPDCELVESYPDPPTPPSGVTISGALTPCNGGELF